MSRRCQVREDSGAGPVRLRRRCGELRRRERVGRQGVREPFVAEALRPGAWGNLAGVDVALRIDGDLMETLEIARLVAPLTESDALRAAVGSGPADLEATLDAFALLDQIVAARTERSLTTVIDTLGLDPERRAYYLRVAREAGLPAVLVIMNTAPALCRERNRERDRPVPAPVLTDQLRRIKGLLDAARDEGWDQTLIIEQHSAADASTVVQPTPDHDHDPGTRPRVILQVSRFPWPEERPRRLAARPGADS